MLPQEARKRVQRLRRRCNLAIFARLLLAATSAYLVVAGAGILACRLFLPAARPYLWVLLPAWGVPLAVAAWLFRGRRYRDSEVEGIADRLAGLGGLLLTLSATEDRVWEDRLRDRCRELASGAASQPPNLPRFRYAPFLRILPYAAFLALALVIPQKMLPVAPVASAVEYEQLKKLETQLQLIREEDLLPPEEVKDLQETVERMAESPTGSHESRWEAIDSLKEKLANEMQGVFKALADADRAAARGDKGDLDKALRDLAKKGLLQDLPPDLAKMLGQDGQELLKGASLPGDPASMKAAREFLERLAQNKCKKLSESGMRLAKGQKSEGGLDDFQTVTQPEKSYELGDKPGEGEGGDGLPDSGDGEGEGKEPGEGGEGLPGRGGITRGRGDAPMIWGRESDAQKVKFTSKQLPPVTISPDEKMPVVGITLIEPGETETPGAAAKPRVIDFGKADGSDAARRTISPRHRSLVRRYFSGEKPPEDK